MTRDRDVERVLHRARGMVRRDVEGLEVVPVVLDLRTAHDTEPERREDVHDLAFDQRERVQGPRARTSSGERDVDPVGGELRFLRDRPELGPTRVEGLLEVRADLVHARADLAAVVARQRAKGALELAERRLAAEHRDLRGVQLLQRRRARERRATARVLVIKRA